MPAILRSFRCPICYGAKRKVDCFLQKEFCEQKRWEGVASSSADLPAIMAVRGGMVFHYDPRPRKAYNMVAFMKALAGIDENAEGDDSDAENGGTEVFVFRLTFFVFLSFVFFFLSFFLFLSALYFFFILFCEGVIAK